MWRRSQKVLCRVGVGRDEELKVERKGEERRWT